MFSRKFTFLLGLVFSTDTEHYYVLIQILLFLFAKLFIYAFLNILVVMKLFYPLEELFLSLHPADVPSRCDFHVPLSYKLSSSLGVPCLRPIQTHSGEMEVTSNGSHIFCIIRLNSAHGKE